MAFWIGCCRLGFGAGPGARGAAALLEQQPPPLDAMPLGLGMGDGPKIAADGGGALKDSPLEWLPFM